MMIIKLNRKGAKIQVKGMSIDLICSSTSGHSYINCKRKRVQELKTILSTLLRCAPSRS